MTRIAGVNQIILSTKITTSKMTTSTLDSDSGLCQDPVLEFGNDDNNHNNDPYTTWNDMMVDDNNDDDIVVGCDHDDWMNDDPDYEDTTLDLDISLQRPTTNDGYGNNHSSNGPNGLYPTKLGPDSSLSRRSSKTIFFDESYIADPNNDSPSGTNAMIAVDNIDLDMDLTDSNNEDDGGANFYNDITETYHHQVVAPDSAFSSSLSKSTTNTSTGDDNMVDMIQQGEVRRRDEDELNWNQNYTLSNPKRHQYGEEDDDDNEEEEDHDAILYDDDFTEVTVAFKTPVPTSTSSTTNNYPASVTKQVATLDRVPEASGSAPTTAIIISSTITSTNTNSLPKSSQANIAPSNDDDEEEEDDGEDDGSVDDVMNILEGTDDDCSIDDFFKKEGSPDRHQYHRYGTLPSPPSLCGGHSSTCSTAEATGADSNASWYLQESFSTDSSQKLAGTSTSTGSIHSSPPPTVPAYVPGSFHDIFEERRAQLAQSMEATRRSRNRVFLQSHVKTRASLAYVLRDVERSSRVVAKHVARYWEEQTKLQQKQLLAQQQQLIQQQAEIIKLREQQLEAAQQQNQQLLVVSTGSNHSSHSTVSSMKDSVVTNMTTTTTTEPRTSMMVTDNESKLTTNSIITAESPNQNTTSSTVGVDVITTTAISKDGNSDVATI